MPVIDEQRGHSPLGGRLVVGGDVCLDKRRKGFERPGYAGVDPCQLLGFDGPRRGVVGLAHHPLGAARLGVKAREVVDLVLVHGTLDLGVVDRFHEGLQLLVQGRTLFQNVLVARRRLRVLGTVQHDGLSRRRDLVPQVLDAVEHGVERRDVVPRRQGGLELRLGRGVEDFAMGQGMTLVPQSYFKTKRRFQQLEKVWEKKGAPWNAPSATLPPEHGTVGCVALDRDGHLAAGTSTGGLTNKLDVRVGDSPIIGAGTYADDAICGLSCTGIGEFFQRFLVAYDVIEQMRFKSMTVEQAATYEVHTRLMKMAGPGSGGIIAMDRHGRITCQFNTTGMFRACIDTAGHLSVALYGDEKLEGKR